MYMSFLFLFLSVALVLSSSFVAVRVDRAKPHKEPDEYASLLKTLQQSPGISKTQQLNLLTLGFTVKFITLSECGFVIIPIYDCTITTKLVYVV